jgi:hypothetical protein
MGLSGKAICRKRGQVEESSHRILCQYPALAGYKVKIFEFPWVKPTDISGASLREVLAVALRTWIVKTWPHMDLVLV